MSLKIAAEHLKSKGRGPDTELVHMTKGEIKGLRQLAQAHGGDLTINPETGLPEAGFLMKVLPIVAAAAATYFTAGAAAPALEAALVAEGVAAGTAATYGGIMAGAGAGALIGGASAGLQGGDIGKGALYGGIGGAFSGGMGAYGGAETAVINPETGAELAPTVLNPDYNAGLAGTTQTIPNPNLPPPGSPTAAGTAVAQMPEGAARNAALDKLAGTGANSTAFGSAPGINAEQSMYHAQNLANPSEVGDIYKPFTSSPPPPSTGSYYSKLGTGMGDTITKAGILAAPGIGAQMGEAPPNQALPTGKSSSKLGRISSDFYAQEPAQPNPYYTSNYEDYKVRAAGGGLMDSAMGVQDGQMEYAGGGAIAFANRGIVQPLSRDPGMPSGGTYVDKDPNTNKLDAYNAALYRFSKLNKKAGIKAPVQFKEAQALGDIEEAAAGGIMRGIGGYSDGGRMLKGPGDGMSDSIPAVIGKKQPARLADGEFVVPADVVSHLGNGSTDAGAKRLYGMMDNIRKARTGKKKQAPEIKTNKFLPA